MASAGGILIILGTTGFELTALRPLDTGLIFVSMLLGPSTGRFFSWSADGYFRTVADDFR